MREMCSVFIIIFLLPYVVAVFINGQGMFMTSVDSTNSKIEVQSGNTRVTMDYDQYLCGVVAYELPEEEKNFYPEFLKAQTIIARTKIEKSRKGKVYQEQFWDSKKVCQMYSNSQQKAISQAVFDTEELVLGYDGKLAEALFFFLSNGQSRSGNEVLEGTGYPYLLSVECVKDRENRWATGEVIWKYKELESCCRKKFQTLQKNLVFQDLDIISKDSTGYVIQIRVGNITMSGEDFRQCLQLPSSCFTLQDYYGKLRIHTTGKGHGIGFSQYSANYMAKEGQSYENILRYFYKDIQILPVEDISSKEE